VIELRVLTPDDWRDFRALRLAALEEAPYAFGSTLAGWSGDRDREDRWRRRLAIPGSYNLLAVLDGEPVGIASGVPADEGAAGAEEIELISMWVSPAGRGHGVGDALMTELERWARDGGARTLRLAVVPDNPHAIRLYERSGFTDTGELGDLMPDGIRRERVMTKPLVT
jgi:ribosomal protein S18 acetylase RimI-like enzyme